MSEGRNVRVEHGHHPRDNGPGVWIHTPYSEEFVKEIKRIPSWYRAWAGEDSAWFVREEYAAQATALVIHHYGETIIAYPDGSEEYRDRSGATARQERLL